MLAAKAPPNAVPIWLQGQPLHCQGQSALRSQCFHAEPPCDSPPQRRLPQFCDSPLHDVDASILGFGFEQLRRITRKMEVGLGMTKLMGGDNLLGVSLDVGRICGKKEKGEDFMVLISVTGFGYKNLKRTNNGCSSSTRVELMRVQLEIKTTPRGPKMASILERWR